MDFPDLDSFTGKAGATVAALALVLLLAFAGSNFFQGTLVGENHRGITLKNCHINGDYDIDGDRCDLEQNDPDFSNMGDGTWGSDVVVNKDGNTEFSIEVDYLRYLGEDFSPQTPFLANNGFLTESGKEDLEEDGNIENVKIFRDDVVWNSDVKNSLEAGSTCSVEIQPYSMSEVIYTYNDSGEIKTQKYHEDWYSYEPEYRDFEKFFPQKVTLDAERVEFTEGSAFCVFDFKKMMDKGAEYSNMVKFEAGRLEAGGDDWQEGYAKISLDFGLDSNLVASIDGPRNTTVGETAQYSVDLQDQDGAVSWSNGETGETANYTFDSKGTETVSVTVDNGVVEDSRSITVDVGEAPEPPSPLDALSNFFGNIWSILTFSG